MAGVAPPEETMGPQQNFNGSWPENSNDLFLDPSNVVELLAVIG